MHCFPPPSPHLPMSAASASARLMRCHRTPPHLRRAGGELPVSTAATPAGMRAINPGPDLHRRSRSSSHAGVLRCSSSSSAAAPGSSGGRALHHRRPPSTSATAAARETRGLGLQPHAYLAWLHGAALLSTPATAWEAACHPVRSPSFCGDLLCLRWPARMPSSAPVAAVSAPPPMAPSQPMLLCLRWRPCSGGCKRGGERSPKEGKTEESREIHGEWRARPWWDRPTREKPRSGSRQVWWHATLSPPFSPTWKLFSLLRVIL
jgi:hypothetical protein